LIVVVAIQADLGLRRIAEPEFGGDRLRLGLGQRGVGLRMRIEFLPDRKFVLHDIGIAEWLRCTVTDAVAAGSHAHVLVRRDRFDRSLRTGTGRGQQQQGTEQSSHCHTPQSGWSTARSLRYRHFHASVRKNAMAESTPDASGIVPC
jgi:hypothetical protein